MTAFTSAPGETAPPVASCVLIANPAAAGVNSELVRGAESTLAASGLLAGHARLRTAWTDRPGAAGELVGEAELVVAIGGDGTASEVVQALAHPPPAHQALCVLPAGSGNSTARALWGDVGCREVLDLLARQPDRVRRRRIDLLRLHEPGVVSILGTSTGFLAQVLVDAEAVDPALSGIDRYFAAALGLLQDMPAHPTLVTVDGRALSDGPTCSVAVGGGRFRARSFQFLPESVLDDGLLDVSTIAAVSGTTVDELAAALPGGGHLGRPDVTYARGRRVVIERTDGLPLVAEYDGSVLPDLGPRLTAEVLPAALTVLGAT